MNAEFHMILCSAAGRKCGLSLSLSLSASEYGDCRRFRITSDKNING